MHLIIIIILGFFIILPAQAAEEAGCTARDKACLVDMLDKTAANIEDQRWKDQTYRELAKILAKEDRPDDAIALIEKIENPDTKAMTIRGIGMAVAEEQSEHDSRKATFTALRAAAEKIEHAPSYAIALTYIAMAQAFAGDDAGAMQTASDMTNDALRNKAYGESAEIQAEKGNLEAVMKSIGAIDSPAFRNKAYRTVSKIFADRENFEESLAAALSIENDYQKSQAILYMLARQVTPAEITVLNHD